MGLEHGTIIVNFWKISNILGKSLNQFIVPNSFKIQFSTREQVRYVRYERSDNNLYRVIFHKRIIITFLTYFTGNKQPEKWECQKFFNKEGIARANTNFSLPFK